LEFSLLYFVGNSTYRWYDIRGCLPKEFEPTAQTIRNWLKQADLDGGQRHDGLTSDEKAELAKLRKDNKRLRQEREIVTTKPREEAQRIK